MRSYRQRHDRYTIVRTTTTTTTTSVAILAQAQGCPCLCVHPFSFGPQRLAMMAGGVTGSAAKRRRERRLRSAWRHEQLSVAMAVAAALHHSAQRGAGPATYSAPRGQKTATEGEVREPNNAPRSQKPPLPGEHPGVLKEPEVQGAMVQHSGIFELEQILDVPVLQMVEQSVEVDTFFRLSLPAVAEQVIDVPKISCPSHAGRVALREPQLVEQLVEVPTVLTYSLLKQRTAEQVVDTPVAPGRGRGARGGLQGSSQGQGSTAVCGAVEVVSPALHARGGGSLGGLQGLSQGQGSTAFCGADNVVSPALHARGGSRGGLQGSSQGQGSTAVCGADNVVSSASQGRGGGARGGLPGLSQGQGSSAVCEAENVDIPAPHGRVGKRGLQRFPRGQSSTASAFEQTSSQAPHRSLPQAPVHGRHDEWVCVVDVENDNEYYWNRWDNTTCWRLPRGVKHRWCRLPSGLYMDVVLGRSSGIFPLSDLHPGRYVPEGHYAVGFGGFWYYFTRCSSDVALGFERVHSGTFVSTAPVAEPTVMSFTVPLNGYTIVATAFIVIPYSSSAQPCLRGPMCCRSVCVAMSCVGGFSLLVVLTILCGTALCR